MKLIFHTLSIKNFLSFGQGVTTIPLDGHELIMIQGINKDVGVLGESKNAAGKTTIFRALTWVLFGETEESINVDGYVNFFNSKLLEIEVAFEAGGEPYVLKRTRKPNTLTLTYKGETQATSAMATFDTTLRGIIGMTLDGWLNTQCLTTANLRPFMAMRPAEQRNYMEEFLDLCILSKRAEALKEAMKETTRLREREEQRSKDALFYNQKLNSQIQSLKSQSAHFAREQASLLPQLEDIRHRKTELEAYQAYIFVQLAHEKDSLRQRLQILSGEEQQVSHQFKTAQIALTRLNEQHQALTRETCPFCRQPYQNPEKRLEVEYQIQTQTAEILTLEQTWNQMQISKKEIEEVLSSYDAYPLLSEAEYQTIIQSLASLDGEYRMLHQQIGRQTTNPYDQQIETLQSQIQPEDDQVEAMKKLEAHYLLLIKLLTDSKSFIRQSLIDQCLPFLNSVLNDYLDQFDSPHHVNIQPDLSVSLTLGSRIPISYGNLSQGEKLRVRFAIQMAFRDFQRLSGVQTNLLLLDEIFDSGGDFAFLRKAMEWIKKCPDTTTLIISHRDDWREWVDKIWTVTKENGFSSLDLGQS